MNYAQAKAYLEEVAQRGSELGLVSMEKLLGRLKDPQDGLKFIHIAGTNGKGSVLAYLSTILKEAGYRVGRYISPTLFSYREKIQVNAACISREAFARHTKSVKDAMDALEKEGVRPTVFEAETAIAFLYFLEQKCDIVVLETGMGGDTDATNVVKTTVLEVLVPISMDHMQFLGNTLSEIAAHKAGIIKPHTAVVAAPQEAEALAVIRKACQKQDAVLYPVNLQDINDISYGLKRQTFSYKGEKELAISLAGTFQILNAATATEAVLALRKLGYSIREEHLRAGLLSAVWKGRFSVLWEKPLFIIDGAHNRAGAEQLKASVAQYLKGRRIFAVCGVFRDKEYEAVLQAAGSFARAMITIQTPDNPRALPAEELAQAAGKYIADVQAAKSIEEAIEKSFGMADGADDVILAFGSLSFLGEITKLVEKREQKR